MSKILIGLTTLAAFAAFAAQAAADDPQKHATGGVHWGSVPERASFNAHDYGAAGDRGQFHYENLSIGMEYTADIVCADVDGNVARFGYVVPNQPGPALVGIVGFEIVFEVTDNGSPGRGKDTVRYWYAGPGSRLAGTCDASRPGSGDLVTRGNLVVHGD